MSATWNEGTPPEVPKVSALGWVRAILRGVPMAFAVICGAVLLLALRLIERPLYGHHRPWTPYIVRIVCQIALRCLGLRRKTRGSPMTRQGAVVANHSTWLDIFVLNAGDLIYFVSKDDVAGWPGIGWLAKITGTVFIARDPRQSKVQTQVFEDRLLAGHRLLFFPEGTSTDNRQVLPFKTSLFAAFQADALRDMAHIQPVSLVYHAPDRACLLYTSPSPRDRTRSRMPSSA